jgi:hypothetical protein
MNQRKTSKGKPPLTRQYFGQVAVVKIHPGTCLEIWEQEKMLECRTINESQN